MMEERAWIAVINSGDIANILAVQSLDPDALAAHNKLYRGLMFGPSPLTRSQRESIAAVVSLANDCHY